MFAARVLILAGALLAGALARAEGVATVTHLSGTLSANRADGSRVLLSTRSAVQEGDLLSTAPDTYARIKFVDGAEAVLRPESQIRIEKYHYIDSDAANDNVVIRMLKGGLRKVTGLLGKRNRERVSINTPTATIGIRGTHFGALLCQGDCDKIPTVTGNSLADGLHLDVVDGAVSVRNSAGQQVVNAGQFVYVKDNRTVPVLVPPGMGVQVTMPPAISQNRSDGRTLDKSGGDDQCTVK